MNRVLFIGISVIVLMVAISFFNNAFDFMGVLFGIGQAFLHCAVFYVVDRYGFRNVDTVKMINEYPWLWGVYTAVYAVLIVSGFVIGYGLWA